MFPHKKAMTPNQVMGHHQLMMQQGVAASNIASSIATLDGHGGQRAAGSRAPYSAFDGARSDDNRWRGTGGDWNDQRRIEPQQQVHPVVEKALEELARQKAEAQGNLGKDDYYSQESAKPEKQEEEKIQRCFLHKKPNKNCKKCQAALQQSSKEANKKKEEETLAASDAKRAADERKELKCSPMLKEQIVNSSYFKRLLNIKETRGVIHEILQDVDTIDVYNAGSKISPSCFICHVFRLSMFPHLGNELDFILDNRQSAVVRCVGFLYIRFVTPAMELWDMLEEYLLDDMELSYNQEGTSITATIGEYVESLLTEEKYFDSPLPRLPVKVKSLVEEKVAPMLQHRKRMQANRRSLSAEDVEDTPVEVYMDGSWMRGIAQGFVNKVPSRTKVTVKLEGGVDVKVHLGKVIIADGGAGERKEGEEPRGRQRSDSRERSRSRGRRGGSPDWSRYKGKSDAECLQDLREKSKDQAVCTLGKHYAKKPLTFDASMASTALANPAGQPGEQSHFSGSRSSSRISREDEAAAEEARLVRKQREEAERQRGLAAVYKKYCAAPSASQGSAYKEVDTPDMLRLG